MYMAEYGDGITEELDAAADQILAEKAAGKNGYRHPASGYSSSPNK